MRKHQRGDNEVDALSAGARAEAVICAGGRRRGCRRRRVVKINRSESEAEVTAGGQDRCSERQVVARVLLGLGARSLCLGCSSVAYASPWPPSRSVVADAPPCKELELPECRSAAACRVGCRRPACCPTTLQLVL